MATAGGVLHDSSGAWIGGFALQIGICSAPLAELWGVYYGLVMAWEKQATRLELEIDSKVVVGFLKTGVSEAHLLSFLICLCHGFISRDWCVRISHVYRETNRLADGLANYAFSLELVFHALDVVSSCIEFLLSSDTQGMASLRRVCL
ncbi:PREDICTED: uncharacterized protein LOC104733943 [Camelina sativa]|uniref:Uncharacterized protein LOC104733943 n=1 Tax=Camelina sativa TaxID=90675 RepID=A0ABM1QR31_CAMSA|nr:PREDICTED: uncharacterized protein LOC104733943 [Camelina sativa]